MSLSFSIEDNEEENWSAKGGVLPTNTQNIIDRTCEQSGCLKGNRSGKETDTIRNRQLKIMGHLMRTAGLENLTFTGVNF